MTNTAYATAKISTHNETYIPEKTLQTWRERSYKSAMMKLATLLEFRGMVEDAIAEKYPPLMQLYAEAAEAMMVHPDTVRANIATIRRYSPDKLSYWIQNGVAFSHIEIANQYAEKAGKTPLQLLDEAVQLGGPTGKSMTVQELVTFATGERNFHPVLSVGIALLGRLGKFPTVLRWDAAKTDRWNAWLDQGREFLT